MRFLKHGLPVRLFPIFPESAREQRSLSIVLATMISVRPFAKKVLEPIGVRLKKRSVLRCYTEVTLSNEIKNSKERPDALIVVDSGRSSWSALVEAKVGKNSVEGEQLERYIELAKINNIDAVISITNELTPAPSIIPTQPKKPTPKNLNLYHLSWASILTHAFLLVSAKESPFDNDDEVFIISELVRYLENEKSGRIPLKQMNRDWPKIVSAVQAGHPINAKRPEIWEMMTTWQQAARDIALVMTRELKEPVSLAVSRKQVASPHDWIEDEIKTFCDSKTLSFDLDVPNAASRITIKADFLRRTITAKVKVGAPLNKARNSARVNWLLKQLQKSELPRIAIRCVTRGKGFNYGATADKINPKSDEIKALAEIVSFEIEAVVDLGVKFNSRKKFVESLEELVPAFYANVGQYVQEWTPPPPKVEKLKSDVSGSSVNSKTLGDEEKVVERQQLGFTKLNKNSIADRPEWTKHWQYASDDTLGTDTDPTT